MVLQVFPPEDEDVSFPLPRSSRVTPFSPQATIGTRLEWRLLERWLASVSGRLLGAVGRARSSHRYGGRSFSSNTCALERLALKILRNSAYACLPNDRKRSVFVSS